MPSSVMLKLAHWWPEIDLFWLLRLLTMVMGYLYYVEQQISPDFESILRPYDNKELDTVG